MFRRHLTLEQRATAAAKLANLKPGANQFDSKVASTAATSQSEAAKMFWMSRESVQRARVILDKGSPELVAMVESGAASLTAAETVARKQPKEFASRRDRRSPSEGEAFRREWNPPRTQDCAQERARGCGRSRYD